MPRNIWVSEEFWKKIKNEYNKYCEKFGRISFVKFTKIYSKNLNSTKPIVIVLKKRKKGYDLLDEFEF